MTKSNTWFVYILECHDFTFYTGITTDVERRLTEHNEGKLGARYTRARLPVKLVYSEKSENRSAASKREWEIKKLSRKQKKELISDKD